MRYIFLSTFLISLFMSPLAFAQGGPPMVTDDPGTPGNGHWEINIAGLYASTSEEEVLQTPYFDINYGWGDHIQLKLETGWVNLWSHPSGEQSGSSTALVGVKYRFLDEEKDGVAISTYPQVQFRHFFSSQDPEIASPGNQYILPFELSKTFGNWEINPEIGYLYGTEVSSELLYGVVLAYEKLKPWEPLAEIHVNSRLNGSGATTLINFGFRYSATEHLNIMAALGHTVTNTSDSSPELDAYLGLQIEI